LKNIQLDINFNFKYISKVIILSFVLIFVSLIYYVYDTLNSTPVTKSYLESKKIQKFFKQYDIKYNENISNSSYIQLCNQYRKDLKNYYKSDISKEVQDKIWKNYKEIYKLQVKIQKLFINDVKPFKMIDTVLEYRYNPTLIYSYKIKGYLATYSNNVQGAIIPLDFENKVKKEFSFKDYGFALNVTLPYINNSLPIDKTEKEDFKRLYNYLDTTYKLLKENRQYMSILKHTMKNIMTTNKRF